MRKGFLLNADIIAIIAQMGHTDGLCIADCGLPIPSSVQRIDVSISKNIPGFQTTLQAILTEMAVENALMAEESKNIKDLYKWTENQINAPITCIPHEQFKEKLKTVRAVVRTGEHTPYANIILYSGVIF